MLVLIVIGYATGGVAISMSPGDIKRLCPALTILVR